MITDILTEIGIQVVRQEASEFLCFCPDCKTKHLYINKDSGLWDCKRGCDKGNLFELVRKLTGWQDKECFDLLGKHGFSEKESFKQINKPKDISWFTNQLKAATSHDLQKLCNAKQISMDSLGKFTPGVHQSQPIIAIPSYDPESGKVCGYLRVGKYGQLVKLKNGKQEKYPAIGEHGLYGLPWLKRENPQQIILCEAWRDALAAIKAGYFATASSGGASTFKQSWLGLFRDKEVYICMDADKPGQKAAKRAAKMLYGVAKAVFLINLPYEVKPNHGKDLHDCLVVDSGDMAKLFSNAAKYEPDSKTTNEKILIANDDPDTVAEKINEYCLTKLNKVLRYNSIDGWSTYKNGRYARIEDVKEIDIFIRKCLRRCLVFTVETDEEGNRKTRYRALKRKSQRFVSDVREYWATLDSVYVRPESKAPASLDGLLDPAYVIPLKNGLLDFTKYPYRLQPHTSKYYSFNYLDFAWEGESDSELWIDFLFTITCGDEELFTLLQQWAGYLLKNSCAYQKFLLCYGDGANGKSVFFDVMMAMLGSQNCSTVPLSKFSDIHYLTQTYGKLANITDESSKGLEEETETALKQYTGGTQVTFKRLYQQPYSAYPTAKIMIATNKLPRFVDTSNGIWRRMLLVPFNAVIPLEKQDRHLAEKIKKDEMSGVLKWALEGLRSLEEMGGFIEPEASGNALKQYKREMNPLVVFLEENFELADCELEKIETKHLRNCYEQWCSAHGYKPKNDTNVGMQIKKLWPYVEKKRLRQGMDRSMYYTKLRLKEDSGFNNLS